MRPSLFALLILPAVAFAAPPLDEAHLYSKQATWQKSLEASLSNLADLERAEADAADAARTEATVFGPWHAIGSFDNTDNKGFAAEYPPEKEVAFDKTYPGMNNSTASWRRMDQFMDGQVQDLLPHFRQTEWAIAYLYRKITAKTPAEITGYFGSDDALVVWLNGEKLVSEDVPRGAAPDQSKATLKLKAGENHLLLKIVNHTGGFGFYFSTKPGGSVLEQNPVHARRVNELWGKVRADFTTPEDKFQMKSESDDGIWPVGWHGKDRASLARRTGDALAAHLSSADQLLAGLTEDLGADAIAPDKTLLASISAAGDAPAKVTDDPEGIAPKRAAYHSAVRLEMILKDRARLVSTRMAVDDLARTYGDKYPGGAELKAEASRLSDTGRALLTQETAVVPAKIAALTDWDAAITALQQKALVTSNPLLDFGKLMYITRKPGGGNPGLPQNWQSNSSLQRSGWDTAISALSPVRPDGQVSTIYRSDRYFIGDLAASYDAQHILFDMPAAAKGDSFQVFEVGADGQNLRIVTESADNDYDNYDAVYLPNGKIVFTSSRCYQAVPCTGGDHVSLAYLMDADGRNVRQLTFDQDHSWNPRVMNDGRVLYTRWEYNDLPHYFSRILFTMNPDGTRQSAFYKSNSYYPNTVIGARPIPGSNTKVVCIASGHHGNPRMGEVAIVDTSQGELEADGVVRILPQRHRKIAPVIVDQYATGVWPQFTHPYPLSDKYFLVSCKPDSNGWWGIYLVDIYDNVVPIRVEPGAALMEPMPLRATEPPPAIPDAVNLTRKDATVYVYDIYRGAGLAGVPRGTIKKLRLIEPVYRYWGNGETHSTAVDGGWDVKRILGTVPVEPDGSAYFHMPANTPVMVQPLNAEGMAQQQMRSWMTAMPGESLSCVGCHERRKQVVMGGGRSLAQMRRPSEVQPWYGPARGFSFEREVQPVLDRNCAKCHTGGEVDFRSRAAPGVNFARFSPAYNSLHPFVRRAGLESDIHMLTPREFEANTSQLVQMLKKGHFGVKLSAEDWDRLITWIDLNIPYSGDWREAYPAAPDDLIRRREQIRAQDAAVLASQRQAMRP